MKTFKSDLSVNISQEKQSGFSNEFGEKTSNIQKYQEEDEKNK